MTFLTKCLLNILIIECLYVFTPIHYVDKKLQQYYTDYMFFVTVLCKPQDYWVPLKSSLKFGDLDQTGMPKGERLIGWCEWKYPTEFRITIDNKFFNSPSTSEVDKKSVIYHELTHCIFREDHSKDSNDYMAPMEPAVMLESDLNNQVIKHIESHCGDKK